MQYRGIQAFARRGKQASCTLISSGGTISAAYKNLGAELPGYHEALRLVRKDNTTNWSHVVAILEEYGMQVNILPVL